MLFYLTCDESTFIYHRREEASDVINVPAGAAEYDNARIAPGAPYIVCANNTPVTIRDTSKLKLVCLDGAYINCAYGELVEYYIKKVKGCKVFTKCGMKFIFPYKVIEEVVYTNTHICIGKMKGNYFLMQWESECAGGDFPTKNIKGFPREQEYRKAKKTMKKDKKKMVYK